MDEFEAVKPQHFPKKVLVALPSGLLEQIDYVAQAEHRTRSDLIREALRRYLHIFSRENPIKVVPTNLELMRRAVVQPTVAFPELFERSKSEYTEAEAV